MKTHIFPSRAHLLLSVAEIGYTDYNHLKQREGSSGLGTQRPLTSRHSSQDFRSRVDVDVVPWLRLFMMNMSDMYSEKAAREMTTHLIQGIEIRKQTGKQDIAHSRLSSTREARMIWPKCSAVLGSTADIISGRSHLPRSREKIVEACSLN